jgi:hypothetical protein
MEKEKREKAPPPPPTLIHLLPLLGTEEDSNPLSKRLPPIYYYSSHIHSLDLFEELNSVVHAASVLTLPPIPPHPLVPTKNIFSYIGRITPTGYYHRTLPFIPILKIFKPQYLTNQEELRETKNRFGISIVYSGDT